MIIRFPFGKGRVIELSIVSEVPSAFNAARAERRCLGSTERSFIKAQAPEGIVKTVTDVLTGRVVKAA
jgi:hypothetical protein